MGIPGQQQQVSGLRQAITNTTNLLNQVAPSVYGRTAGSLVTSAQAGRQISNEQAPIQTQLGGLNTAVGNASSDLNTNLTRASNLATLKVQGQTSQQQSLMDLYKNLQAKEEFAQQQALEQQKAAETARANKAGEAIASRNASTSASRASAPSASQGDIATARGDLVKLQGGDGYVSPQTYARVALQWANAGYSLADFNKNFAKFKNPNNPNYTL